MSPMIPASMTSQCIFRGTFLVAMWTDKYKRCPMLSIPVSLDNMECRSGEATVHASIVTLSISFYLAVIFGEHKDYYRHRFD